MDSLTISIFGKTCGIGIYPTGGLYCVTEQSGTGSPFGNAYMLITAGYLISLVMVIPLGVLELVDNVRIQIASFVTLIFIIIVWLVTFIIHGLTRDFVPFVGNSQSQVVGTVLYNYAFITTVPSWVHDTGRNVPIRKIVWISIIISTILYVSLGVLGGMAYVMDSKSNIIAVIGQSNQRTIVSLITTYLFPIAALVTSIPVFTIVVRLNLMNNNNLNKKSAILLSSFIPWIVILPFQTGVWLNEFMNWTSLIFSTISNFVLPFYLYHLSYKQNLIKDDKHERLTVPSVTDQFSIKSIVITQIDDPVKIVTPADKNNNLSLPIVICPSSPKIYSKNHPIPDDDDSHDNDHLTPSMRTPDTLRRRRSRSPSKSRSHSRSSSKVSIETCEADSHNSLKIDVKSFDVPTLKTSQPTIIISDKKCETDIIDNLHINSLSINSHDPSLSRSPSPILIFEEITSMKSDENENSKPDVFIAFPGLNPKYGIRIATFCGIIAILLACTMIFYDFVELGMGNNVFS
ncbi:6441_t:CDS:2 [Cetraspora pellucida]|uniref:6441_t:CDS:1 n=1 Tax=Cetraspora pellucida TaxID=1433469 RepID=A0A9N9NDK5_9GLOM|nr:6441_t:CDS:2 [Cetraspora pellucida]